jgi:hypothetical protein
LDVFLLVFSQMAFIAVRASDDLLWTVLVQMFLQESLLKLRPAVVDAENVTVFAVLRMFLSIESELELKKTKRF